MKRIPILLIALGISFPAKAQVNISEPELDSPTYICPNFFGPYAFPVPEQIEAQLTDGIYFELGGDAVEGHIGGDADKDYTFAPTFKLRMPLWTDRVNLSIWGEAHEWYKDTPQTRLARRVSPSYPLQGNDSGNIYFSLDLLLLREAEFRPAVVLRAVTQTATGDDWEKARHYDAPGYFFDLGAGKNLILPDASVLRISASTGFLCWQTDNGRQNDAAMLGVMLSYTHRLFKVRSDYALYKGWEECYDSPKVARVRIDFNCGRISPFLSYTQGLHDWPFKQLRAGVSVSFDLKGI